MDLKDQKRHHHKAVLAMIALQFIFAGYAFLSKAALSQGMNPRVLVVYRQALGALITAPIAVFTRWRNPVRATLGVKGFALIFISSLIGVTANYHTYIEGLYLSSSTIATAMNNLLPAVTFVMATLLRMEKINVQSLRSIAKITGTVLCIGGGICMALLKGPAILDTRSVSPPHNLVGGQNLPLEICPDHLYSTLWTCILSTIQSAVFTLFMENNTHAWRLRSALQLGASIYAGFSTATAFFIQSFCISQRGPVFSAVFSPLCTIIGAIFAVSLLHENLYTGSLVGAFAVIVGLYVVLWGKAKDVEVDTKQSEDHRETSHASMDDPTCTSD